MSACDPNARFGANPIEAKRSAESNDATLDEMQTKLSDMLGWPIPNRLLQKHVGCFERVRKWCGLYVAGYSGYGGLACPFAPRITNGLARPCFSRFWRDRAGMFIHHCASANAVPILMRT